ncbi:MAG: EAL domain-containing protein [Pseudomonadota bacterium]
MTGNTSSINARKAELLRAFLNQVPGRVSAILENWHKLVQGDWNSQLLSTLQERLNTLTEASGKFGVGQIKLSGQSLLSHLAKFGDSENKPTRDDVVTLDGLIHAFKDAAIQACDQQKSLDETAASTKDISSDGLERKIFLLGIDESTASSLTQSLQAHHFMVETLTNTEALYELLASGLQIPCALISHIDRLEELYPTERHQGLWRQRGGLPGLPVAFIANSNDLQLRLAAMRTESKAYWTMPVDPFVVASRMQELTSPDNHAAYRVLIVEDDPSQADFASAILKKASFECRNVTDPLVVMEALYDFSPDLILMDLYMPGASGTELTTVIREQSEFVDTPVVFLSGEHDRDKQLKALSFGGEDFLSKPIAPKHLISTVTNRIQRAQQLTHRLGEFNSNEDESGLFTRQYLFERVDSLLSRDTFDNKITAVFYLEIDSADEILNRVGIGGMDVVLAEIGAHLSQTLQPNDVLSRFGDSSIGLLACRDSKQTLEAFGRKLCSDVAEQILDVDNRSLGVTLSIGAYLIDDARQDARSLFSRAKLASNVASNAGGNQIHIQAQEEAESGADTQDAHAKLIIKAIDKGYFEIFFQPIVALKGSTSDEALYQTLIRLQEPEGKLLMAGEFIPTAEKMGVISKIDQWTTRSALSIVNEQHSQGNKLHLFTSQSVDLLENMERLTWLREKHRNGLLHKNSLTFEFRLSEIAKHLKSAKMCFDMLAGMEIGALLTGVTNSTESQRVLNHLNIKYIKLHTELLQKPDQGLKELISLAHSLDIKVIAPQVEDPRSIALLWSSGTDYVQGFFVQRPENNLIYDFNDSVLI